MDLNDVSVHNTPIFIMFTVIFYQSTLLTSRYHLFSEKKNVSGRIINK